jgi:hypothetical protein
MCAWTRRTSCECLRIWGERLMPPAESATSR